MFFIDPRRWRSGISQEEGLRRCYVLPQKLIQDDEKVRRALVRVLRSKKQERARAEISRLLDVNDADSMKLFLRAIYKGVWCRDLCWFLGPSPGIDFFTMNMPLRRQCHHCRSSYGYPLPVHGKPIPRSFLVDMASLPKDLLPRYRRLSEILLNMRSEGIFDDAMREIAKAMRRLQESIGDYVIVPILIYYKKDKPIAMTACFGLSPAFPGNMPNQKKLSLSPHQKKFYKPCIFCRAEGAL